MTNVIPLIRPLDRSTIIEQLDAITGPETTAIVIITMNDTSLSMRTWGEKKIVLDVVALALSDLIGDLPPESYAH